MPAVTQLMQDQVTQLYIGFFGRAPDASGFSYWTTAMSNGASQQTIANSFSLSPEFKAAYDGLTPTQQVTKLYQNILNRNPDTAGLDFWVNAINNGASLPSVVVSILNSCVSQGTSTADGLLIANKTTVGEYFAITLGSNNTSAAATAYTNVTSDPNTVTIAQNALQVSAANQINITSPAVGTFNGANGANAFIANVYTNPSTGAVAGATLVNGDVLNGSANGPNTLKADLYGTSVTSAVLNNISNYELSNSSNTAATLSVASAGTAARSFTLNNPVGNVTVSGVSSNTPSVVWNGSSANNTAAFSLTATSGAITTNQSAAVMVKNVVNATGDYSGASANGFLTVDNQYAGLNLTAVGSNTINTGFVGRNNYGTGGITINGAGNLTLGGSAAATIAAVSVSASSLTGNLTTTLSDSVTTNYVGGSGNDSLRLINNAGGGTTISLGAGTNFLQATELEFLTSGASLTGGSGTDTLALTTVQTKGGSGLLRNMSGMDTLQLAAGASGAGNTVTFGTNLVNAGFTTIRSTGTSDSVTLQSIPTALSGLTFTGIGTGNNSQLVLQTAGGTFTVSNYNVSSDASVLNASTITIAGTGNTTVGAAGAYTQTLTLGSATRQTLTLAGSAQFAVTGSAATGNQVILGTNTGTTGGATTITGSTGGLVVDTTASAAANTFNFAAGGTNRIIANDIQVSAARSIVGGAGTDTLTVNTASTMGATFDTTLSRISAFDVLALQQNAAGTSNLITLGTNFVNAGFTSVTGLGTMDQVTLLGATPSSAITFAGVTTGGTATNSLIIQTASGTFTVNNIGTTDLTAAGATASTITVGGTGQSFIDGGTAASTISFASNASQTLTVRAANTLTVNAGGSTNDQVVLLGTRGITVNGGTNSVWVDSQNSTAAHTINFSGSSVANNAVFSSIQQVSAASSLVGGSGTDTLRISAVDMSAGNAAASLRALGTGWNTLALTAGNGTGSGAGLGSNQITLGTNFVNAGFTSITGIGTGDQITLAGATLSGLTISGGGGSGNASLTLNTAGGTVTVVGFGAVTGSGATNGLTIGASTGTANIGISLRAGSTVTNSNTGGAAIVMSGATTYTGNMSNETITLGGQGTFSTTITGGGGNDVLYLQGNTAGTTVTTGGNTGTFSIVGGLASGNPMTSSYGLTVSGTGQYVTTGVNTVTFAANSGVTADMVFNNTGALNAIYTYSFAGNNTAAFSLGTGTLASGGYFGLTVNSSANDTILINNSNWSSATQSANIFINANTGYQTITLAGAGAHTHEIIGANLTNLAASTNTANGFIVSNWGTGNDRISLGGLGATLASANQAAAGTSTVLNTAYLDGSGNVTNTNSFTLGSTFVTGTSTTLANLTAAGNSSGQIFEVTTAASAGNFNTQAGINTAVTFITTNIGSSGVVANQKAVLSVHDGSASTALFLWTNGNDTSGISSSELKLIGVLTNVASTSASMFI